jgi:RND family efflux transporter MFP subunit
VTDETSTAKVVEKEVPVVMEAVGTLNAQYSTNISSKIMATILKIHAGAGDEVNNGKLLVDLDDRDIKARLNQAKKELEAAQSSLTQSESDFKRHADLFKKGVESRQQFEEFETRVKVNKAQVAQATEAVNEAEVMLSYTKIFAPYDGRVTDKLQEDGEMAMPGRPIMKMYNPSRLRLEANVPESLKPMIEVGDTLEVRIDAVKCKSEGQVEEIVPSADTISRTFLARVSVPCKQGLYEGMFGRLIIPVGTRKSVLVPQTSVYLVGQIEMVNIVDNEGHIIRRAVKTGPIFDDMIEVISGVSPGEKIIIHR